MSQAEDDGPAVDWSFDELAAALGADRSCPRGVRRAALADARRLLHWAEAGGVAPGAVRFRAIRCTCCGALEVTGGFAPGARARVQ